MYGHKDCDDDLPTHRSTYPVGLLLLLGLLATTWLAPGILQARCLPQASLTTLADLRAGMIAQGQTVTVAGTISAAFLGANQLGGFFLQDTTPTGVFIYAPHLDPATLPRQRQLQVSGRFGWFHGRPQLSEVSALNACGAAPRLEPVTLRLPEDYPELERYLDVLVRFDQDFTITGNHELGRYGSLHLVAGPRELIVPTGEGLQTHRDTQLVLDDGSYRVRPTPIPYLDASGTRRSGDHVQPLEGILARAFDAYRLHPTQTPRFSSTNPRPTPPQRTPTTLRIATLNLENYFLSLGQRGAATLDELDRQRTKLIAALSELDADLLALIEVENRPGALHDLVRQTNQALSAEQRYQAVPHPDPGDDAIKVAILYRPALLRLRHQAVDPAASHKRRPLLAWFSPHHSDDLFGIAAVHHKAKVGCPEHGDVDHGQGCWNELRTQQSRDLLDHIQSQRHHQAPVLIAGDLNAYAHEEPLRVLQAGGKIDTTAAFVPAERRYTYVFRGQAGQLDYLLAPEPWVGSIHNAGIWAINADEPRAFGYAGRQPTPGPWRSSDHDPVWADKPFPDQ